MLKESSRKYNTDTSWKSGFTQTDEGKMEDIKFKSLRNTGQIFFKEQKIVGFITCTEKEKHEEIKLLAALFQDILDSQWPRLGNLLLV